MIPNTRTLQDLNLQVSVNVPAAAANVTSASIDTAIANPGRVPEVEFLISMPAPASLADTKNITITLYDSADNVTFGAVAQLPAFLSTGAGGVGGAAIAQQFKLPIGTRRYLAINVAEDAAGGGNTAVVATLAAVF